MQLHARTHQAASRDVINTDNSSACTKDKTKTKQQSGGTGTIDSLHIHRGGAHVAQEDVCYYGTTLFSAEGG